MKNPAARMLKATATAFGLARKESDTTVIEAAIANASAMIAEGEREEAEALDLYRSSLLDEGGTPEVHLAAQQQAKIKRDRGEAQVAALTLRLAAVREAEEESRRRAIYDAAEAKAEAARVALVQEYPAIARQVHGILRIIAEAETAVEEANAALPAGAAPMMSPELQVRSPHANLPLLPEPVEEHLWATFGGGDPLSEADQRQVRPAPGRPDWVGVLRREDGSTVECHRRTFRKVREYVRPAGDWTVNLAGSISLPALFPFTPDLWPQNLSNGVTLDRSAEATLAALGELESLGAPVWRRQEEALKVRTRFEEIGRSHEFEADANAPAGARVDGMHRTLRMSDSPVRAVLEGRLA